MGGLAVTKIVLLLRKVSKGNGYTFCFILMVPYCETLISYEGSLQDILLFSKSMLHNESTFESVGWLTLNLV
jgi:hypothetical protein